MPLPLSVIMTVHNGEKYLREAVESILNQTFGDFEFIVVDDGSSDCSLDVSALVSRCASEDLSGESANWEGCRSQPGH